MEAPIPDHAREESELLRALACDPAPGLGTGEALRRLERDGPNVLRRLVRRGALAILLAQVRNLITALLAAAALVSWFSDDVLDAVAIGVVLLLNTAIGFWTELHAVRSMEALRALGTTTVRVLREGRLRLLPAEALVVGDLVRLEGGDVVTADLRLLGASRLQADESLLTGESVPVDKAAGVLPADTALVERSNCLWKGTHVTRGTATGVVVATGMATELGKVALLVESAKDELTPLEQRLRGLGHRLLLLALGVAAATSLAGVLGGRSLPLMVETGLALAVAAIPEGLPIVATLGLARGMFRLARRNALVQRLSAVETLGSTTLVCTDKTGTLTENQLRVTSTWTVAQGERARAAARDPAPLRLLEAMVLCNDASFEPGSSERSGDPLEIALLECAHDSNVAPASLRERWPRLREQAFDPDRRYMVTVHRDSVGTARLAVKGAAEAVLPRCTTLSGGEPLGDARRAEVLAQDAGLAADGSRVLALAEGPGGDPAHDEGPWTFLGLVALSDPPRAEVTHALSACRRAGIRVVMLTGDQAPTALAIGRAVGLVGQDAQVVSGAELLRSLAAAERDPEALERALGATIFSRVDPATKLALVRAFQERGHVVAMTGDGVNDAPALRQADIGVAMGQRGTQVAREAADVVLKDDSFASIVEAVRTGRIVFDAVRKFVVYLLTCNLSEVLLVGLAVTLGLPLPLLPLQLLFLNLVTDVFPALALAVGSGERDVLERAPRPPAEPILSARHWRSIVAGGACLALCVLGTLALARAMGADSSECIVVSFFTLAFAQLWQVFLLRPRGVPPWRCDVVRNPAVWAALALCTLLLFAACAIPRVAHALELEFPRPTLLALILGGSVAPVLLAEGWRAATAARPLARRTARG